MNLKKLKINNVTIILIISIVLSFVCGILGAYVVSSATPVKESIVKNITTSELVETSISSSVDKVYDRTVVIKAYTNGKLSSTGTGFIYKIANNKVYIMTNNHVIEDSTEAKIEFNDNDTVYDVNIVGGDKYSDIAVLTLDKSKLNHDVSAVSVGDSSLMKLGDTIFTVGAPMGVNYKGTVTKGIISGLNRMVETSSNTSSVADYIMKVIQIDAAVNPGNSGGPLSDVNGNVIGIISLKIVQNEVEGMGFAIPIEDALNYAKVLENGGSISRPYLGVSMTELSDAYTARQYNVTIPDGIDGGILIVSVEANSAAANAKLQANDIIVKINNVEVSTVSEFRYELYKHNVGEQITLSYYRNGKLNTTNVILGKKAD